MVRHQRESESNRGFRHLARYIHGRDTKRRATWFHAANLPGGSGRDDLELACKLVDAVQVQNTRAGSKHTYHLVISLHSEDRRLERAELEQVVDRLVGTLGFSEHRYVAVRHSDTDHEHIHVAINKIHPETFRIHSPAWDYQKLFTGARALERELGLSPLRWRTREHENVPQRAAVCEAHHGVDSFARWARETLRSWLESSTRCGYANGSERFSRCRIAALPVAGRDRKQIRRQLALRANHRNPSPQQKAREPTRPFQRGKGVVRFSEMEWKCSSAIRSRNEVRCKST